MKFLDLPIDTLRALKRSIEEIEDLNRNPEISKKLNTLRGLLYDVQDSNRNGYYKAMNAAEAREE